MVKTLEKNEIQAKRDLSLKSQPLRREIHMSNVKVLDQKHVEINGVKAQCTPRAMSDLLRILGLSKTFIAKFEGLFNQETSSQLINRIRMAQSNQGSGKIWVTVNPYTKTINGFSRSFGERMSTGEFLGFTDTLFGDSNMELTNWSVGMDGSISINGFNKHAVSEVRMTNGETEVFTGGLNVSMNFKDGLQVRPYVNRQWCSNGLVTQMASEMYTLNRLDSTTLDRFYQEMAELKSKNWIPTTFGDRIKESSNTAASIHEMKQAHKQISKYLPKDAEHWVPLNENMAAYRRMGVDVDNMSYLQEKKSKSNTSIWDLTNALTHVATHGKDFIDNFGDEQGLNLMVSAGDLLGRKNWDHEGEILNPFNELRPSGSLLN